MKPYRQPGDPRGSLFLSLTLTASSFVPAAQPTVTTPDAEPVAEAEAAAEPETPTYGGTLGERPKLTGDWGGVREDWARHGFTLDLDLTYTFQGVVAGGAKGPLFDAFSKEDSTGHTFSGLLGLALDTEKAGLWKGGFFDLALEGRVGRSVVERAGSLSAVNNDALFPDVVRNFDEGAFAITELAFTQYVVERVALFGGLLNTAEG